MGRGRGVAVVFGDGGWEVERVVEKGRLGGRPWVVVRFEGLGRWEVGVWCWWLLVVGMVVMHGFRRTWRWARRWRWERAWWRVGRGGIWSVCGNG